MHKTVTRTTTAEMAAVSRANMYDVLLRHML